MNIFRLYRLPYRLVVVILFPLLTFLPVSALSQTGMVREAFGCNFLPGKDMGDLMGARDYMAERLGDDYRGPAFVWTPIVAEGSYDFLWFNQHESLAQWGNLMQSLWGTERFQDIMQRFLMVADCKNALLRHTPIHQGSEFQVRGPAVLVSYACNLREGADLAGVNEAVVHWQQVVGTLPGHRNFNAFMQVPMTNADDMDLFFFGVYPDFPAYASGMAELQASSEYAAVLAHFGRLQRCRVSLWEGQPVLQPQ